MPKRVQRHAVEQPQDQSIRHIALTLGQHTVVDTDDFDELMRFNWLAHWVPQHKGYFYAKRHLPNKGGLFGLHSQLIPCASGCVPDHIDGDTLNNRRSNLQELPHWMNLLKGQMKFTNTSGVTGVVFDKARGLYAARIGTKHLGRFPSIQEAKAVREAAVEHIFADAGKRLR